MFCPNCEEKFVIDEVNLLNEGIKCPTCASIISYNDFNEWCLEKYWSFKAKTDEIPYAEKLVVDEKEKLNKIVIMLLEKKNKLKDAEEQLQDRRTQFEELNKKKNIELKKAEDKLQSLRTQVEELDRQIAVKEMDLESIQYAIYEYEIKLIEKKAIFIKEGEKLMKTL